MIELKNIGKYYGQNTDKLHVLRNITLSIQAGEVIAITGPSGSGKSTLLNIIGLLDHYSTGSFELNSKLIKNLREDDEADLRNTFIGFIFQSFHLISYKTALENVELPLIYRRLSRRERREIAIHFLEKVDLGDRINHLPAELSGGQKQRVAIARSLVTEPQLIIADEPTGALDSKNAQEILNLLLTLNKDGKTIILVTHDDNIAKRCQRIVRLDDGCIVEDNYVVR